MELIHTIEKSMAEWFKQLPHLPKNGQKWLAENAWWIVAIGVIVSVLTLLTFIPILLGASLFLSAVGAGYAPGGLGLVNTWVVSLGFGIAVLAFEAMAINPLREGKKQGWDLLFIALVLSVVSSLLSVILLASAQPLIGAILTTLVGGYFLFEVRGHFKTKLSKEKATAK